jgi:hypothetical protein
MSLAVRSSSSLAVRRGVEQTCYITKAQLSKRRAAGPSGVTKEKKRKEKRNVSTGKMVTGWRKEREREPVTRQPVEYIGTAAAAHTGLIFPFFFWGGGADRTREII